ncbi:PHD finger protein 21A-like isoform X2 [Pomacea canaliculata]|uniref:PHD finger protein 21A-like isoform X2 n=1 Tax=Pomacea canaliculata TaxID=400727 RepID=UPI000D73EEE9|nr:PHD finger protein 21A-like isoform X2 [Pomacea canaliculata]
MSRADLDAIQAKLKAAIQSHQMLVMKLKSEPQNATMKDKLHELQTEIMNLSKEQKVLVQELRQELMQNSKKSFVTSTGLGSIVPAGEAVSSVPSNSATASQARVLTLPSQALLPVGVMVPLAHVQAHSTLLAFPGVLNQPGDLAFRTDGQDQRHLLLNLQTLNSTAVTAAAAALHNNNNNIATSAVGGIKQPPSLEPSIQPWRGSPPIKVPQYPISQVKPLQQSSHNQASSGKHDSGQSNGFIHRSLSDSGTRNIKGCLDVETKDSKKATAETKSFSSEEKKKMDFMACLDLVTPASLKEMQTRRVERKRRSTANPQFSYNFEPERRRGNSAWLNGLPSVVPKKPRGRPFKPGPSPLNSRPGTPDSIENAGTEFRKQLGSEGDNHDDVCAECGKEGKLLLCSTCTLVYHLDCLSPPLATVPPGPWSCPGCIVKGNGMTGLSNGALTMVHSYINAKASKEEEKRKLQRKSTELLSEKLSLQEKTKRLQEQIVEHKEQKQKLTEVTAKTAEQVETLTNFIKVFQTPTTSVKLSETTA